jgi:GcrA cell cycle regulator
MSEERKLNTIKSLWARGDVISDIAQSVGMSLSATKKRLVRAGLRRVKGRLYPVLDWPDEQLEELRTRWARGESGTEIAKVLGVSRSAVLGKLSREGLKRGDVWAGDRLETLKKHHAEGKNPSEIGKLMGMSRSGIIGKLSRLGLRTEDNIVRKKTNVADAGTKTRIKRKVEEAVAAAREVKPVKEKPVKPKHCINIMDLTYTTCRWPEGDPRDDDFGYCGAYVEQDDNPKPGKRNSVYCTKHHAKAHNVQSGSAGGADAKGASGRLAPKALGEVRVVV